MRLTVKLAISLVVAVIAATLTTLLLTGQVFDPMLMAAFAISTVVTTLLVDSLGRNGEPGALTAATGAPAATGQRSRGTVKWFNTSKGFGFIVKEDGEELFVHFRSIRGAGRRGLRDGQRVSFIVAQSDKGPQAEDVVGEN